jgi:serine/threonine protein kinase
MVTVEQQIKFRETYQIIERISEGNFGQVYKVKETKSNVIYAMKKVPTSTANRANTIREIDILSKMDHENIVKLVDWEVKPFGVNMIFEYCEMSLDKYLSDAIYPLSR